LNLGLAITSMVEQTQWTEADLGILSAIFFWTYGLGHLFNGRLGEIFGLNRFIIIGVILSVVANLLIGLQSSLIIIAILWGLNGYFQSMLWSPGMALLANWWPGNSRGFATGLANAFSGFGSAFVWVAVFVSFSIAPGLGWKSAFIFPMIFMAVFVIFYKFITKEKPSDVGLADYAEADDDRVALEIELRELMRQKGKIYPYVHLFKQWRFDCWLFIIACSSIARYGLMTWIPSYFVNVLEYDIKGGIMGTVMLPLGMGFGTLIVPWLTDKFCPNNRLPAVVICALAAGAMAFVFPYIAQSLMLSNVLLFLAGFFIYAINGCTWAYATDVGGRVFGGTASGILDCFAYLGASVQAIYFGFILGDGNWSMLFLVIGFTCCALAVVAVIAGLGVKTQKQNAQ
jgi:sugar phosphate permease